jgi:Na+-transporting NADH:ubiquinone oxidoreductase subunit NqrC
MIYYCCLFILIVSLIMQIILAVSAFIDLHKYIKAQNEEDNHGKTL